MQPLKKERPRSRPGRQGAKGRTRPARARDPGVRHRADPDRIESNLCVHRGIPSFDARIVFTMAELRWFLWALLQYTEIRYETDPRFPRTARLVIADRGTDVAAVLLSDAVWNPARSHGALALFSMVASHAHRREVALSLPGGIACTLTRADEFAVPSGVRAALGIAPPPAAPKRRGRAARKTGAPS